MEKLAPYKDNPSLSQLYELILEMKEGDYVGVTELLKNINDKVAENQI